MISLLAPAVLLAAQAMPAAARAAETAWRDSISMETDGSDCARLADEENFQAALPRCQDELVVSQTSNDEHRAALTWHNLARVSWGLGDESSAISSEKRALALCQKLGDTRGEALSLNGIGLDFYTESRYDDALDYYRRALDADRCAPSKSLEALVDVNMGMLYKYQGRYAEAEPVFEEALRLSREGGSPYAAALASNHLGILCRKTGRYPEALEHYSQALEFWGQVRSRRGESQTHNNLGNVFGDFGQPELAIAEYSVSLRLASEIGYRAGIAYARQNIGGLQASAGRYIDALGNYRRAAEIWESIGRRRDLAEVLTDTGDLLLHGLNDPSGARAALEKAFSAAREIGDTETQAAALENLAEADLRDGHSVGGLARLNEALVLERKAGIPDLEAALRSDRGAALNSLGQSDAAIEDLRAAVGIIDDLRGNVRSDPAKIGFQDMHRQVFERLALALSDAGCPEDAWEAAEMGRARALADLLASRAAGPVAPMRGAGQKNSGGAASPKIAEVRDLARRLRATIVEYLLTANDLLVWAMESDGRVHTARISGDRLHFAAEVETALQGPGSDTRRQALLLEDELITPIERWLPADRAARVLFIPDGPLMRLSFAALTDRWGRVLVDRHTIFCAPALSVFRYTRAAPLLSADRHSGRTLIVADPAPPRGSGLARLPGARREGNELAARLPRGRVTVLVGEKATETAVKRLAPAAALLHFATHGLVSEERPLASCLVLAADSFNDGYLRADEILHLDLHADLVVLSGCSTGGGRVTGDGIVGLTRAFFSAGCPSLIVSQWEVSDRAAAFVMNRFYAARARGIDKAAALAAAQRSARRRFSAGEWAPFILVGEPD